MPAERRADRFQVGRFHPVRDEGNRTCMRGGQFGEGEIRGHPQLFRRPAAPVHHQHHRRTEIGCHFGIERQLAGGRDVGVIAAQHEQDVETADQVVEPTHDLRQRRLGVGVHHLVTHADRVCVGLLDCRLRQQQLHHEVGGVGRLGDRTEDTDLSDLTAQQVHQAQRHR